MGKRVITKAEDLQPAEGRITVRRPDAVTTKLPVLVRGQHRLMILTEYHDGTITATLEGTR